MKIVLVHYHLRPGGVSQVLLQQAAALKEAGEELLVLCGEIPPRPDDWTGISMTIIPGLHYDRFRSAETVENLAVSIQNAIRSLWPGGADLVHVHNPLIRKNSLLIGALKILSKDIPLLLQNHDLAEDFRPDVYIGEEYPENCHYGVINSRDYDFLLKAGLKPEGLHLLPNEVRKITITPGLNKTRYLYPVRGIRRKNIGEALFLSVFLSASAGESTVDSVAITQPPTTDQDLPIYNRWKEIAAELQLPVEFEVGLNASFSDVMGSAKAVITTSVKEGFGFSFLEPWTAGIPVTGRRINYVCADFEQAGVNMDALYPTLIIPAEYTDAAKLEKKTTEALSRVYAAFGLPLPSGILSKLHTILNWDLLDFGIMDEELQENILRLVLKEEKVREKIKMVNPFLETLPGLYIDPAKIEFNRKAVLSAYSRENILGTIYSAYKKTLSPVTQSISRSMLLELYIDPSRLYLSGISPAEPAPGSQK